MCLRYEIKSAFQSEKNVVLHQNTQATFFTPNHEMHVCFPVSQKYGVGVHAHFWYTTYGNQLHFLLNGNEGYLVYGMKGEKQAIVMSIGEFVDITKRLNPYEQAGVVGRHVHIDKIHGRFQLRLRGVRQTIDLTSNVWDWRH